VKAVWFFISPGLHSWRQIAACDSIRTAAECNNADCPQSLRHTLARRKNNGNRHRCGKIEWSCETEFSTV